MAKAVGVWPTARKGVTIANSGALGSKNRTFGGKPPQPNAPQTQRPCARGQKRPRGSCCETRQKRAQNVGRIL
eukprot:11222504-Lingulodinium_polyedra.AAC.1